MRGKLQRRTRTWPSRWAGRALASLTLGVGVLAAAACSQYEAFDSAAYLRRQYEDRLGQVLIP